MALVRGLADAAERPCIGLALGDSITEGLGLPHWSLRYQTLLQDRLRRRHSPEPRSGSGYLPSGFSAPESLADATRSSGTELVVDTGGLGSRLRVISPGGYVSWPETSCDRIWLHYTQHPERAGRVEVLVNGAVRAELSTRGRVAAGRLLQLDCAANNSAANNSAANNRAADNSAADNRGNGEHGTVRLTVPGVDGTPQIEGASFFAGPGGVYLFDAAHGGHRADLYLDSEAAERHWESAAAIDPVFITCMLGANDMAGNWDIPIPPQEWGDNLRRLLATALDACPRAGFFFYHWTERNEDAGNPGKLAEFEQAAVEAIGGHPRVSFHLLSRQLPPGSDDSLGWHLADGADLVHPNEFGHRFLATVLPLDTWS